MYHAAVPQTIGKYDMLGSYPHTLKTSCTRRYITKPGTETYENSSIFSSIPLETSGNKLMKEKVLKNLKILEFVWSDFMMRIFLCNTQDEDITCFDMDRRHWSHRESQQKDLRPILVFRARIYCQQYMYEICNSCQFTLFPLLVCQKRLGNKSRTNCFTFLSALHFWELLATARYEAHLWKCKMRNEKASYLQKCLRALGGSQVIEIYRKRGKCTEIEVRKRLGVINGRK